MNDDGPMAKVELRSAFWWTCDSCGRDNYGHNREATESDLINCNLAEIDFNDPSNANTVFYITPDTVICGYCGTRFEVEIQGSADFDQSDD